EACFSFALRFRRRSRVGEQWRRISRNLQRHSLHFIARLMGEPCGFPRQNSVIIWVTNPSDNETQEVAMSANEVRTNDATRDASVDLKLEAIVIPVSDVDRAKKFYGNLGWRLDADFRSDNGFRVVQFTPPSSGCSVQF